MSKMLRQEETPIFSALEKFSAQEITPLFVPGHKYGRGCKTLVEHFGSKALATDLTSLPETDNLSNPKGIIKDGQELVARLFGADYAYFLVNGTSEGLQAMIRSVAGPSEKVIIPRNAHKATYGGLIVSGAEPVFVYPEMNSELGLSTVVSAEAYAHALDEHPDAVAILVINPTYYGYTADLSRIVDMAHSKGVKVIVDEAHGAHLSFHPDLPQSAMEVGADLSVISMHKTGGSLTQSSVLLVRGDKDLADHVLLHLNLTRTTSPSYLLLTSLDLARRQLALQGTEMLTQVLVQARKLRKAINQIDGLYAFGGELVGTSGVHAYDETKLNIHLKSLEISGYQLERELMLQFGIGFEFAELNNLMGILSLGDTSFDIEKLVSALKTIVSKHQQQSKKIVISQPFNCQLVTTPREAFFASKQKVSLEGAVGHVSGEMIMAYPPGIPIICPGERFTPEVVQGIINLKKAKASIMGAADQKLETVQVLKGGI